MQGVFQKKRFIVIGLLCALGIASGVIVLDVYAPGASQDVDISLPSSARVVTPGGGTVEVEVVATPQERSRGLSGRTELLEGHGMLFVFPRSGLYSFWMPDMNFAIDIIWIDERFEVVYIEEDIGPETYPESFISDVPARFVLEVNAGGVDKYDVEVGDVIRFENVGGVE